MLTYLKAALLKLNCEPTEILRCLKVALKCSRRTSDLKIQVIFNLVKNRIMKSLTSSGRGVDVYVFPKLQNIGTKRDHQNYLKPVLEDYMQCEMFCFCTLFSTVKKRI